ncbi:MAG: PfkB family carbohydrate kinase [Anaerolineales bacterium]
MRDISKIKYLILGEAVVDLISTGIANSLEDADNFRKFAGGEASNLAMNLSRMGFPVSVGACVGQDSFGVFLHNQLTEAGIDLSFLQTTSEAPTTSISISRQTNTPDFIVYRGADRYLNLTDELISSIPKYNAVHTSAFALSQNPSRSTIYQLLKVAYQADILISLDPNFHPAIWPDLADYLGFLKEILQLVTVTKPSLDDCNRIFGPGKKPTEYLELFLELGPEIVVLTQGSQGALVGTSNGEQVHLLANSIPVVDVTGAGDAFWSGLLTGLLTGLPVVLAAKLGQVIAEYKIGILGPMKKLLPMEEFMKQAKLIQISSIS